MTKFRTAFLLTLFLLVIVRIYHLSQPTLFGDEMDVGYQALSLLQSGRDYKGNFLPLYIQSLTESRAPLLMYASLPSVALFGLTPLAIRLPPLIFGLASLLFFYLLIAHLSQNKYLSLYSYAINGLSSLAYPL